MRTSNKHASEAVQALKEFQGNNTFARIIGGAYVVFSYGEHFPIFVNKKGKWYRNSDRYSVSTSKHQTQLCPLPALVDMEDLDTWDMKKLYS